MNYTQFQPHIALAPYIDAYWQVTNVKRMPSSARIMPDGCMDILINWGEDLATENESLVIRSGAAGLVGTMTRFKIIVHPYNTNMLGVRFKPAAFSYFYNYASLQELTDTTIEFEKKLVPDINPDTEKFVEVLDRFFISRMALPRQTIYPIVASVRKHKGQTTVDALAKHHFISKRQLERNFKQQVGLTPKEFISFIRYEFALQNIRQFHSQKSLLEIAFESGYYDHSHLCNEIRKYTGLVPSQL